MGVSFTLVLTPYTSEGISTEEDNDVIFPPGLSVPGTSGSRAETKNI